MEFENDRKLNCMDLMMKVVNNTVNLDSIRKPSPEEYYHTSNHPHCHKIGIISIT